MQALAGVLLPSATVFLLLCIDKAFLGPWVNRPKTNVFTATVVAILITLSIVLTAAVMFPSITARQIFEIMTGCAVASALTGGYLLPRARGGHAEPAGDCLPAAI